MAPESKLRTSEFRFCPESPRNIRFWQKCGSRIRTPKAGSYYRIPYISQNCPKVSNKVGGNFRPFKVLGTLGSESRSALSTALDSFNPDSPTEPGPRHCALINVGGHPTRRGVHNRTTITRRPQMFCPGALGTTATGNPSFPWGIGDAAAFRMRIYTCAVNAARVYSAIHMCPDIQIYEYFGRFCIEVLVKTGVSTIFRDVGMCLPAHGE